MLKRYFSALLLLALLGLPACSKQAESTAAKIGICIHDGKDAFESEYAQSLAARLREKGYAVTLEDARKDQTVQNSYVQSWIAQSYDALVLSPVITAAADELVTRLRTARIPAVFTCREPDGGVLFEWDRVCYVGCDAAQPGAMLAQQVLALPAHGDVTGDGTVSCLLIQNSPDRIDTHLRTQALRKAFAASDTSPQILNVLYAGSEPAQSQALCAGSLNKLGPQIDAVLCSTPALASGALNAIHAAGRIPGENIYLFCAGGTEAVLKQVADRHLTGTVMRSPQHQAQLTVQALERLLAGQPVEKRYYADHIPVTAENVQKYLSDGAVSK
jgi:ABC-type sugar transport system substrate-binding protein